jgi:hypothetical protein
VTLDLLLVNGDAGFQVADVSYDGWDQYCPKSDEDLMYMILANTLLGSTVVSTALSPSQSSPRDLRTVSRFYPVRVSIELL